MHRPYHQSRRRRVPVALITTADGVCHPTPAALIISRQRRHSIYPHRGRADRKRTNENNDKRWRNRARTVGNGLSDRGRAGRRDWLQRRADSAGVSQTDAGRPWAAAAAALLVIYGVAAGMRRELQQRLWDVRYGGGRLERRVQRWAAQWWNVSRLVDKLSNASSPPRLSPTCIVMEYSVKDTECTHRQRYMLFRYLLLSPRIMSKTCLLRELNCRTFEIWSWFRISAVVWFWSERCVQVIHCRT